MAVTKGPLRRDEYDAEYSVPPNPVIEARRYSAAMEASSDGGKPAPGYSGPSNSDVTEIIIDGDVEEVHALELSQAIGVIMPHSFLVRKGGYIDCHWSKYLKDTWYVQVVEWRDVV